MQTTELHIIHTRNAMLLSKAQYVSWREIQDQYPDYQTSLGPCSADEVVEYLDAEYSDLEPAAAQQVAALVAGAAAVCVLSFRKRAAG